MKAPLIFLITVLMATACLASCAAPATQPPPTQPPPTQVSPSQPPAAQIPPTKPPVSQNLPQYDLNAEIVKKMIEKLNAGDVEGSLAYFADDARIYIIGFPLTGFELYNGKDMIRAFWQDMVNNHFQWEVKETIARGDLVYLQTKTWHDFTRQIGVAPLEYYEDFQVIDRRITSYGSWLTEDSLARFRPAFAAVVPPEPTATPFSGTPGTELAVTTTGGACTIDAPLALKAGEVKVNWNVQDQDKSKYALSLFTLDPGKDILDLMVATHGLPPSWGEMVLFEELVPGESKSYLLELEKGPLYLICWSKPPDLVIGNSGPIPVVP